jgi:nucleoside-diphosphate-sugar epimerase
LIEHELAKYLVTGAAGFIGRSIAAALLERGESVRGIDSFITGKRANLAGLEAMEFHRRRPGRSRRLRQACAGVEIVFPRGGAGLGPALGGRSRATNRNCVDATLNLLVAARAAQRAPRRLCRILLGLRRHAHVAQARRNAPQSHQPLCRGQAGRRALYARLHPRLRLETVTLRYFNVFGPLPGPTSHYSGVLAIFCRKMLAGEQPTIYGDGEQSRDFTFIDNVVAANLLAAAAPAEKVSGKMMNVATGEAITLNQTFETLRELTGYTRQTGLCRVPLGRYSPFSGRHPSNGVGRKRGS